MKKIFAVIMALGIFAVAHAAAPTYAAVDGVYEWYVERTLTPGDTLAGADDSTALLTNYDAEPGWQYILYRKAYTGGGTDSLKVYLRLDNQNSSNTVLYSTNVDSFTVAAGEAVDLSYGGVNFGDKFSLKLKTYTDNGGEVINPTFYLIKRRPYNLTKGSR